MTLLGVTRTNQEQTNNLADISKFYLLPNLVHSNQIYTFD